MVDQLAFEFDFATEPRKILGIAFSPFTKDTMVRRLLFERVPAGEGARLVVTANLDHISHLAQNPRFQAAYDGAWAATADGMPVYLYARLRGSSVPERVTGADLVAELLNRLPAQGCRPFFVVSQEEAAHRLRDHLIARGIDGDAIGWACPSYGFETDQAASDALAQSIRDHGTTLLFFSLGAPKSEIWLHEHRHVLGDTYALAIGASLDFFVGLRRRAPVWMRRVGLEWTWRLASEPRRLFSRYFVESWAAARAMLRDLFQGSSGRPQADVTPAIPPRG